MKTFLMTAAACGALALPVSAQTTPAPITSPSPAPSASAFPLSKLPMPDCKSGDPVVLVDDSAKKYYTRGSVKTADLKDPGYMCQSAAVLAGDRPAKAATS